MTVLVINLDTGADSSSIFIKGQEIIITTKLTFPRIFLTIVNIAKSVGLLPVYRILEREIEEEEK
jgi:hypothetical protein